MNTLLVSYDLVGPDRDYDRIIEHLSSDYEDAMRPLESFWLIQTSDSASEVRDRLQDHYLDSNDKVVVIDVTDSDWASYNLSRAAADWMKKNM